MIVGYIYKNTHAADQDVLDWLIEFTYTHELVVVNSGIGIRILGAYEDDDRGFLEYVFTGPKAQDLVSMAQFYATTNVHDLEEVTYNDSELVEDCITLTVVNDEDDAKRKLAYHDLYHTTAAQAEAYIWRRYAETEP